MAGARILIADDNEFVAVTLEEQLKALGYEVVGVARTDVDALEMCVREQPDLVLLEMQLGGTNAAATARQIVERMHTPIVIMTAASDEQSVRQADQAGALAYLVKPVSPEELPPVIDVALARHREMESLRDRVSDLQDTIEARKVLERAVGILMKRSKVSRAESEERIRQRAAEKNITVQEMAQAIVDSDALLS